MKRLVLLSLFAAFSYNLFAQGKYVFSVKDNQSGSIHSVEINLSDCSISATDSKGEKLYVYHFYGHEKNKKGRIAFAFKRGEKPKFNDDSENYFIMSSKMIVNTLDLPDVVYLYTPVNENEFLATFQRMENELSEFVYSQIFKVNGVEFKMMEVKGGTFRMGCDSQEARNDEMPIHFVSLSDYYIAQTEVTQELWTAVMTHNPSKFKGAQFPVEQVSWNDCQIFINKLNAITGQRFRLPTEAEWEYAAKGGNRTDGFLFAGNNQAEAVAWHNANANHSTHAVAQLKPNEALLYDMSGNVWEWCADWSANYPDANLNNPTGAARGTHRIIRGGAYNDNPRELRTTTRNRVKPEEKFSLLGFRLAM